MTRNTIKQKQDSIWNNINRWKMGEQKQGEFYSKHAHYAACLIGCWKLQIHLVSNETLSYGHVQNVVHAVFVDFLIGKRWSRNTKTSKTFAHDAYAADS